MKLLIVDDSLVIRNRIERALAFRKIKRVLTAANGVEALEVFRRERPELVTMDITMPLLDGIEATAAMVRIRPDVQILIVSAIADKATAIEALKRGANGFLLKPFTDAQLNTSLATLTGEAGRG
jgi:two-component system chemotaxis response regulator CheY